jgi:hypothetical protein
VKLNYEFVAGVAYINFLVGMAVTMVGNPPSAPERIGWDMPVKVFIVLTFPFIMGFMAGKKT